MEWYWSYLFPCLVSHLQASTKIYYVSLQFSCVFTACKRSLGQSNIFRSVPFCTQGGGRSAYGGRGFCLQEGAGSQVGSASMGSASRGSASKGFARVCIRLGGGGLEDPSEIRKAGDAHPTRMLSCFWKKVWGYLPISRAVVCTAMLACNVIIKDNAKTKNLWVNFYVIIFVSLSFHSGISVGIFDTKFWQNASLISHVYHWQLKRYSFSLHGI